MKSYYLFHAIFNFCVIFLILQHMKQNHNHITSYQSAHTIKKNSNKSQIRCHSNDLKHATIPINVSKDRKKNCYTF
jgi:hypothetical protein